MVLGRRLDLRLKAGVHRPSVQRLRIGSIATRQGPARSASPTSSCSVFSKTREPLGIGVAELDLHFGTAGDDRGRVRLDQHAADRPHRARAGDLRESGRGCGSPAAPAPRRHPCAAPSASCRRGSARRERDPVVPDADDRLDHADAQPARCRACRPARYALRDSRHSARDRPARAAGRQSPRARQRLAQRRASSRPRIRSISSSASVSVNERLPRKLP